MGFFRKLDAADVFVLYDTAQYSKNGYHNRCQIKTPRGLAWLTVPVKSPGRKPIKDVEIDNGQGWQVRIWRTIEANYSRAPFFSEFGPSLEALILDRTWARLVELNIKLIQLLRDLLSLDAKLVTASSLPSPASSDPTEKIVALVRTVGGTVYLSGSGGRNYLKADQFREISLRYSEAFSKPYPQLWGPFVPNLSILDTVMNYGQNAKETVSGV